MKLYTLKIGFKEFRVYPVKEPEEMKEGLSNKPPLAEGKGMLFHFGEPQEVTMNTMDMKYPIDMIFIDGNREVIQVKTTKPGIPSITVDNTMCVLEVNKGEGEGLVGATLEPSPELVECMMGKEEEGEEVEIMSEGKEKPDMVEPGFNIVVKITSMPGKNIFKEGGSFTMYEDVVKAEKDKMQVLDDTGRVLMNIEGGERIFSIKDTDNIVELSKKIDNGEADPEELGKLMKEIIHRQNTQEPEYV